MEKTTETYSGGEDINRPLGEADEAVLWAYIDGSLQGSEKIVIEKRVIETKAWASRYKDFLELHQLLQASEMEAPSLRFTKNVMEEIAISEVAPAAKEYINKRFIWCVSGALFILIIGLFCYGMLVAGRSETNSYQYSGTFLKEINYRALFDRDYVHIFMMLNVIGALVLADRFLGSGINKLFRLNDDAHVHH
jgi:hypothetical protein